MIIAYLMILLLIVTAKVALAVLTPKVGSAQALQPRRDLEIINKVENHLSISEASVIVGQGSRNSES